MPELKVGSDVCKCGACHKHFSSTFAFDRHRTGSHSGQTRRCLNTDEMLSKGMGLNAHGRWVSEFRGASLESTIEPWPIGDGPEAPTSATGAQP